MSKSKSKPNLLQQFIRKAIRTAIDGQNPKTVAKREPKTKKPSTTRSTDKKASAKPSTTRSIDKTPKRPKTASQKPSDQASSWNKPQYVSSSD